MHPTPDAHPAPVHPPAGEPADADALRRRRAAFGALVLTSMAGLLALMSATLFASGVDTIGTVMLALFAITLPWTTIGFWNAAIGLALMRFARDPEGFVAPHLRAPAGGHVDEGSTALLVCVRHEDTDRLARNLGWMLEGLLATGEAGGFHLYVLSDSDRAEAAAGERELCSALERRFGHALPVTYRRREHAAGFKAGNVRDFCERWGSRHRYAIVLDADSVMAPGALLRLVRIMQAHPRIGILQTLVTGLPSASPFARVFQFGMRLGMRSYTLGAASWQADCGPYWGHNAILRLEPFIAHCALPVLPGEPPLGGHVLSHDQIEAVLMRRAGYEVRVLPDEDGSWEENPPNLPEFIRRDLRWCQGNLQYFAFLRLPGLAPVSRAQVALAIAMYAGAPAWMGFLVLGLVRDAPYRADLGVILLALSLAMSFAPKLATLADVLARAPLRRAFGGGARVVAGALVETVFSMLVAPVSAFAVTVFVLGLPFGRRIGWTSQQRDARRLPLAVAARALWPQTLAGIALAVACWRVAPGAVVFWAPLVAGLAGAIPLALVSAHPGLGRWMVATGLCRIPEEAPPAGEARALGAGAGARALPSGALE